MNEPAASRHRLWGLWISAAFGSGLADSVAGVTGGFVARLGRDAKVLRTGILAEGEHRISVGGDGHKIGTWPKRDWHGARVVQSVQSVPGHEGGSPVACGRCGGALG
jgi:hypothetical protein